MQKLIIALSLILSGFTASATASSYVHKDSKFDLAKTPDKWAAGDQICFSPASSGIECSVVTTMGEIALRENSVTSAQIDHDFNSKLSDGDRLFISGFDKFIVRYLALDGDVAGRYIVQVFYNFSKPTEAIYVYGTYTLDPKNGLKLTPQAFGDSAKFFNLALLRKGSFEQQTVKVANKVILLWANQNLQSFATTTQN